MSKYTAIQTQIASGWVERAGFKVEAEMLRDLARRLRQEEEENRRDPVMEPRPGDRVIIPGSDRNVIYGWGSDICPPVSWASFCKGIPGATIIRRREVQP